MNADGENSTQATRRATLVGRMLATPTRTLACAIGLALLCHLPILVYQAAVLWMSGPTMPTALAIPVFLVPLLIAIGALWLLPVALLLSFTRPARIAALFMLAWVGIAFATDAVTVAMRRTSFEAFATRTAALGSSLQRFVVERGHPPATLVELVDEGYLARLPATGFTAFRLIYQPSSREERSTRPWSLRLSTFDGVHADWLEFEPGGRSPPDGGSSPDERTGNIEPAPSDRLDPRLGAEADEPIQRVPLGHGWFWYRAR